jgi:hypothetical protein
MYQGYWPVFLFFIVPLSAFWYGAILTSANVFRRIGCSVFHNNKRRIFISSFLNMW